MDEAMTVQSDQLASYIANHPVLRPYAVAAANGAVPWPPPASHLPTVEEFAAQLLEDAEFGALGLGSWLGTPDGRLIADAVGQVIPPTYHQVYGLAVDGLQLAAAQRVTDQRKAGGLALAVVVGSVLIAMALRDS
jgi:hypothetical protein